MLRRSRGRAGHIKSDLSITQAEIQNRLTEVNVQIDWQRAFAEQWPICTVELHSIGEIRALYVAWYCGNNGPLNDFVEKDGQQQRAYLVAGAHPVTVGEVADNVDAWTEKRNRIGHYAYAFQTSPNPISVSLVSYALPEKRSLILDGNHRAVAAVLSGKEVTATLIVICGPCDPKALRDLKHWSGKSN